MFSKMTLKIIHMTLNCCLLLLFASIVQRTFVSWLAALKRLSHLLSSYSQAILRSLALQVLFPVVWGCKIKNYFLSCNKN